ncbi:hypothetical protein LTR12_005860 [Friedmanniomyces endolithicus]|nr:hypothetical protein LTR12_005860 [Friedmanniomyces endolithicus]
MAHTPDPTTPPAKSKRKASSDSDSSATRKAKVPKLTAKDYSNGNDRGFIKPLRPRRQRVKWTAANDRKLLLLGLQREIIPKEHAAIAASFLEGPTIKSIQEHLTKLRKEQLVALDALGLGHPTLPIRDMDPKDNVPDEVEDGAGDVEMTDGRAPAHTGRDLYEEGTLPLHVMAAAQREIDGARKGKAPK